MASISMIITNKAVKDEFLADFYKAYDKYFKSKPYMFYGDHKQWSVSVGFAQKMFPHQPVTFSNAKGDVDKLDLVITLHQDVLASCLYKARSKELKDNEGYLVSRYMTQEGFKDKEIKAKIKKLSKRFLNDVLTIQGNEFIPV